VETIKAGRPLVELFVLCFVADVPLLLVGPHGIGKSQIAKQAAEDEMGIGYICCVLSTMDPTDLEGLPWRDGGVTRYAPPDNLPRDKESAGLLVLEELNRCERLVRAPALQMLTARALNSYALPPGWTPVACVNPEGGEYDVDPFDPALSSRFVKVNVAADRKEWLAWARRPGARPGANGRSAPDAKFFLDKRAWVAKQGIHPGVIAYVDSDDTAFDDTCPRDWEMVSKLVWAAEALESDPAILEAAVAGVVGNDRALAFRKFRKRGFKPPTADEVLGSYRTWGAKVRGWGSTKTTDVLDALTLSVRLLVQSPEDYEAVRGDKKKC
jgi:MoxR-like ATPase